METEIAVMIGYRHACEDAAFCVGFHKRICPTPVNRILAVRADTLEMSRVGAFALSRKKRVIAASAAQADKEKDNKERIPHRWIISRMGKNACRTGTDNFESV